MRFESITIEHFKNVGYGKIQFENPSFEDGPSILGIYGENGSGKTAVIDCIRIFQNIIGYGRLAGMGGNNTQWFHKKMNVYFRNQPEPTRLTFCLRTTDKENEGDYRVEYQVEIRYQDGDSPHDQGTLSIAKESLSVAEVDGRLHRVYGVEDDGTVKPAVFKNDQYVRHILGGDLISENVRSLLFEGTSPLFGQLPSPDIVNISDNVGKIPSARLHASAMKRYALEHLHIIDAGTIEDIDRGLLNLSLGWNSSHYSHDSLAIENNPHGTGIISVPTSPDFSEAYDKTYFDDSQIDYLREVIASLSKLTGELVPDLSIDLDVQCDIERKGFSTNKAYLVAKRGSNAMPFACESRGTQKLVALCWPIIAVHDCPHATVAIDEFDTAVSEFLLGRLLGLLNQQGEGQLIFTAHNLRPLEVLDKKCIAFSTANPENRYIKMRNVKTTNNLRDFYYRAITLGGQKERLFESVDESKLSDACLNVIKRELSTEDFERRFGVFTLELKRKNE